MQITDLHIKNFRCLKQYDINLAAPIVLISGHNGSGKTTILEALHYGCYLRSFRTHLPRELINFDKDNFFIKINFNSFDNAILNENEVQVGFADKKRLVRINKQAIQTYKELTEHYRIITITDHDMMLINGGPDLRRSFIDQGLTLFDIEYPHHVREYKKILHNRNALLLKHTLDIESYDLWTHKLWQKALIIIEKRKELTSALQVRINNLLSNYFDNELSVSIKYKPKKNHLEHYELFLAEHSRLKTQEAAMSRTLFGPHLDDISIQLHNKKSKAFASRGQQKLIIILLKVALLQELTDQKGPVAFLLDDIMADFDPIKLEAILTILTDLNTQLIFTSPHKVGYFEKKVLEKGALHVTLTG